MPWICRTRSNSRTATLLGSWALNVVTYSSCLWLTCRRAKGARCMFYTHSYSQTFELGMRMPIMLWPQLSAVAMLSSISLQPMTLHVNTASTSRTGSANTSPISLMLFLALNSLSQNFTSKRTRTTVSIDIHSTLREMLDGHMVRGSRQDGQHGTQRVDLPRRWTMATDTIRWMITRGTGVRTTT